MSNCGQLNTYHPRGQGEYAANIFYIVSLLLAKITISMMIMTIAQRTHRRMIQAIEILIGAWAITGLAVVFFQCQLPSPWDYISSSCIQRVRNTMLFPSETLLMPCSVYVLDIFLGRQHRNRHRSARHHGRKRPSNPNNLGKENPSYLRIWKSRFRHACSDMPNILFK